MSSTPVRCLLLYISINSTRCVLSAADASRADMTVPSETVRLFDTRNSSRKAVSLSRLTRPFTSTSLPLNMLPMSPLPASMSATMWALNMPGTCSLPCHTSFLGRLSEDAIRLIRSGWSGSPAPTPWLGEYGWSSTSACAVTCVSGAGSVLVAACALAEAMNSSKPLKRLSCASGSFASLLA